MTSLSGAPHKPTACPKIRVRYISTRLLAEALLLNSKAQRQWRDLHYAADGGTRSRLSLKTETVDNRSHPSLAVRPLARGTVEMRAFALFVAVSAKCIFLQIGRRAIDHSRHPHMSAKR